MSNIEFSDEEHAALTAMLRRAVYGRSFPRWPRLEPLRAALAKLDPASMPKPVKNQSKRGHDFCGTVFADHKRERTTGARIKE
jgi:hypothetical protein